jgi:hypothetical protein
MKKVYFAPEMDKLTVATLDVITVSTGEQGDAISFGFKGILDGSEGWLPVD